MFLLLIMCLIICSFHELIFIQCNPPLNTWSSFQIAGRSESSWVCVAHHTTSKSRMAEQRRINQNCQGYFQVAAETEVQKSEQSLDYLSSASTGGCQHIFCHHMKRPTCRGEAKPPSSSEKQMKASYVNNLWGGEKNDICSAILLTSFLKTT